MQDRRLSLGVVKNRSSELHTKGAGHGKEYSIRWSWCTCKTDSGCGCGRRPGWGGSFVRDDAKWPCPSKVGLVRSRDGVRKHLLAARHQLAKFLLKHDVRSPEGVRSWTSRHLAWLRSVHFDSAGLDHIFQDHFLCPNFDDG